MFAFRSIKLIDIYQGQPQEGTWIRLLKYSTNTGGTYDLASVRLIIPITYAHTAFINVKVGKDNNGTNPFKNRTRISMIDCWRIESSSSNSLIFGFKYAQDNSYMEIYYKLLSKISEDNSSIILLGQCTEKNEDNIQLIGETTELQDSDFTDTYTLYNNKPFQSMQPINNIWNQDSYAIFENCRSLNSGVYHFVATICTQSSDTSLIDIYFIIRYHHSVYGVISIIERPVSGRDKIDTITAELMPGEEYKDNCFTKVTITFKNVDFYCATLTPMFYSSDL